MNRCWLVLRMEQQKETLRMDFLQLSGFVSCKKQARLRFVQQDLSGSSADWSWQMAGVSVVDTSAICQLQSVVAQNCSLGKSMPAPDGFPLFAFTHELRLQCNNDFKSCIKAREATVCEKRDAALTSKESTHSIADRLRSNGSQCARFAHLHSHTFKFDL